MQDTSFELPKRCYSMKGQLWIHSGLFRICPHLKTMTPEARGLAQHGGPPGWLGRRVTQQVWFCTQWTVHAACPDDNLRRSGADLLLNVLYTKHRHEHRVHIFTRDETGPVYLPTQLERTLQLYWWCKCNRRGWACTPYPHQSRLILPSWLYVRQKADVTALCSLWSWATSRKESMTWYSSTPMPSLCL